LKPSRAARNMVRSRDPPRPRTENLARTVAEVVIVFATVGIFVFAPFV
jgi:hypothetical protein